MEDEANQLYRRPQVVGTLGMKKKMKNYYLMIILFPISQHLTNLFNDVGIHFVTKFGYSQSYV